MYLDLKDHRDI